MSDYRVTITTVREKCPFDAKRKSKEYCKVCKAWKDPCSGLGIETTISSRKIGEDKMKQIINKRISIPAYSIEILCIYITCICKS